MVEIAAQEPADQATIDTLLNRAFGAGRSALPSYRLREGIAPIDNLGFAARDDDNLVAILRFWPTVIGGATPALLLGPLAVDAAYRHRGIASSLVRRGLGEAQKEGHRIVVAVGNLGFFGRFGFIAAAPLGLTMPGLADPNRFLALAFIPDAFDGVTGRLGRVAA